MHPNSVTVYGTSTTTLDAFDATRDEQPRATTSTPDGRRSATSPKLAGVSIATVSRVINDRPDVVAGDAGRVLRHIRSTTSRRTAARGRCRRVAPGLIGITVPMVQGDYFAAILAGASEALYEQEHARRPLHDPPRARARGVADRAPDRRRDRRRDHPAPRGVERGAARARRRMAIPSSSPTRASRSTRGSRRSRPRTRRARGPRSSICSSSGTGVSR